MPVSYPPPPPPGMPDMYSSAFEYGYPTTPMPALPRGPMLGEQPVASGVQPPGPPPATGLVQPYSADGWVEQLVPIEVHDAVGGELQVADARLLPCLSLRGAGQGRVVRLEMAA